MIFPSNRIRILVATTPIDFRKGHDSLAALVKNELRKDPFTGTVFVFRARKADRLVTRTSGATTGNHAKPRPDTSGHWPAMTGLGTAPRRRVSPSPMPPVAAGSTPNGSCRASVASCRLMDMPGARVSAKSRLGEALSCIAKYRAGLGYFLNVGRVEIDSNTVERTIRPIALNRKNALFAGHDAGAGNWAVIASLVETCKMNSVDPLAWLADTLTAVVRGHRQSRIDGLLPWKLRCQAVIGTPVTQLNLALDCSNLTMGWRNGSGSGTRLQISLMFGPGPGEAPS